jgi:hypothetical protein
VQTQNKNTPNTRLRAPFSLGHMRLHDTERAMMTPHLELHFGQRRHFRVCLHLPALPPFFFDFGLEKRSAGTRHTFCFKNRRGFDSYRRLCTGSSWRVLAQVCSLRRRLSWMAAKVRGEFSSCDGVRIRCASPLCSLPASVHSIPFEEVPPGLSCMSQDDGGRGLCHEI